MFSSPSSQGSARDRSVQLRRAFGKHRRLFAALLAGLACLFALGELRPTPPKTVSYISASAALPAGHIVTAADITAVEWPERLPAPLALTNSEAVIGRTTAGPLASGELVSESRLVGPGLLEIANIASTTESGSIVAAPVRLADPGQASLVRPGDLVDVLAARAIDGGGQLATLVAADAIVITVPGDEQASDGSGLMSAGDGAGSSFDGGQLIVLAVDESTATDLAAAATRSQLSVVLKGRSRPPSPAARATDLSETMPADP